ncbi:phosphate acetyltransferase [Adlercreutzia muris]|nr:phosphate acetyltransferase [Adlercreutzia muris]NCA31875.1 phosphate acetyltransferase [Adlercreutzia muris]
MGAVTFPGEKGPAVSAFLDTMIAQAKSDKKTIVLPEGNDIRTLKAAEAILADDIADVIILGNPVEIAAAGCNLNGARIVDFRTSELRAPYAEKLAELRAKKGMTAEAALELMDNELYFGMMMVKMGEADGLVSGACHSTGDVLRPALQILKTAPGAQMVSSFFVMNVPDCDLGHAGTFLFSDCGLEVQPDAERLAQIAINAEAAWRSLIDGAEPVVAMLSHSSYGSARNDDADKVVRATALVKELAPELAVDGELQLDAAIVPEIGASKAPASPVAGRANVLVFPDIDAGNIGYKLVQRLAKAEAYGPILQGIAAPVNDLSRGCTAEDIVGVVAITAVQAQGR